LNSQTSQVNPDWNGLPGSKITLDLTDMQKQITINYHESVRGPIPGEGIDELPTVSATKRAALATLREMLREKFSTDEIYDLCADTGMEYENFSTKKNALVREMVEYAQCHDQLTDLIYEIRRKRPTLNKDLARLAQCLGLP
jgi:hypothetical protein